jgi:hypothetical protein
MYLPIPYICGANTVTPNSSLSIMGVLKLQAACAARAHTHTNCIKYRCVPVELGSERRDALYSHWPAVGCHTELSKEVAQVLCAPLEWDMGAHSTHTQTERNTQIFSSSRRSHTLSVL